MIAQFLWDPSKEPVEGTFLEKVIQETWNGQELQQLVNTEFLVELVLTEEYDFFQGSEVIDLDKFRASFSYVSHRAGDVFPAVVTYKIELSDIPHYI